MRIVILHNEPRLSADHPDAASEAGVLAAVSAYENVLTAAGHEVIRWGLAADLRALHDLLSGTRRPHVVVNLFEGWGGQPESEAWIAGLLEAAGVPFTGASAECLSLVRRKHVAKWLMAGAGVPTAPFHFIAAEAAVPWEELSRELAHGPLFVKPAGEDASLGIDAESVVVDRDELARQLAKIRQLHGDVLVERYIPGREFNVGLIGLPDTRVLPLSELEFTADPALRWPILTYRGKWVEDHAEALATPVRCPANVEPDLAERIRAIALQAYRVTGCRDYARVDLRVTPGDEIFVLEVNANPDTSPEYGLSRSLNVAGISHAEFVERLIETAAARGRGSTVESLTPPHHHAGLDNDPVNVAIRRGRAGDLPALGDILAACRVFRPDEVAVGREVLEAAFQPGGENDYTVLVAELAGQPVGWSCHGLVPMTDATFDLYWIAVDPAHQSRRIGRRLLDRCEDDARSRGGRWLIAETSTTPDYAPTRAFYLRRGYALESEIADFYRPGDGRAIFTKRLDGA